jgi:polysaccharide biosynthesis protein VpsQ
MKWVSLAFGLFLITIVVLADRGELPAALRFYRAIPGGDYVGHLLLMGTLSFFVNLWLRGAAVRVGRLSALKGSLVVAAIVTVEELTQLAFPERTFSLYDLTADFLGIYCFGRLAAYLLSRQAPPELPAEHGSHRELPAEHAE